MKINAILVLLFFASSIYGQNQLPESFSKKINNARLKFTYPKGYVTTPVIKNKVLNYDYAIKMDDKENLCVSELRFIIIPQISSSSISPSEFIQRFKNKMALFIEPVFQTSELTHIDDVSLYEAYDYFISTGADEGKKLNKEFTQNYNSLRLMGSYKKGNAEIYVIGLSSGEPDCLSNLEDFINKTLVFVK